MIRHVTAPAPHHILHRFCVAPMMEWTDRHCRMLHRCLSRHALLYTEMVTAEAVIRGKRDQLLGFDAREHPVAVQLGGSEPARLAEAAKICEDFGYDEVNLNAGCPSDRVQSGRFGACLMLEPQLVAECMAAMSNAVRIPVTLKCRIGVDDQTPAEAARAMIAACKGAGTRLFIMHARKAWLKGLSPKQNRTRPPLDYALVYTLKRENPDCTIVLNGGIETLSDCQTHLSHLDGVMLGRAAYQTPEILAGVDAALYGGENNSVEEAVRSYLPYVEEKLAEDVPLNAITRHMLGLFAERPGARAFRRHISENAPRKGADIGVLREALSFVMPEFSGS